MPDWGWALVSYWIYSAFIASLTTGALHWRTTHSRHGKATTRGLVLGMVSNLSMRHRHPWLVIWVTLLVFWLPMLCGAVVLTYRHNAQLR